MVRVRALPKIMISAELLKGDPKKQKATRLKNKWIDYKRENGHQNMKYVVVCFDRNNKMIRKAIETDLNRNLNQ